MLKREPTSSNLLEMSGSLFVCIMIYFYCEKKARTKLTGERCILMTTFGDKIRELRKEKYELPPEAIREMIINAIVIVTC